MGQRPKILAFFFRVKVHFSLFILYVYFLYYSPLERLYNLHSNDISIESYNAIDHEIWSINRDNSCDSLSGILLLWSVSDKTKVQCIDLVLVINWSYHVNK